MSELVTLGTFVDALTFEASIDGQVTADGRHPPDEWLYPLANRVYRDYRSLASQYSDDFYRVSETVPLPARQAGEDYIPLEWPIRTCEIVGVDVQLGGTWYELTRGSFAQRRVWPGANRCESPGEWAVFQMPQPSDDTVTAGNAIAVWPYTLSGNYKLFTIETWQDITDPNHLFVIYPGGLEWMLCKAAVSIIQRDNNKKAMLDSVLARLARAELAIAQHARRWKRGVVVARRRDGLEL